MASLRLDATDSEHRLAADIDHIAAQGEGQHGAIGKAQLARADENHFLVQVSLGKLPVDAAHAELERQGDMVAEDQGRGAGTSLSPIDSDEVNSPAGRRHQVGKVSPESGLPHSRFDADRQTALLGKSLDKIEHAVDIIEGRMARRAVAGLAMGNPPYPGNFTGDL